MPVRNLIASAAREPLTHFLVLGAAVLAISQYFEARSRHNEIAITPAQVRQIAQNYQQQYGQPASPQQLDELVEQQVDEEILYREALKLGLDEDDEIIRRRLVQKYEFLKQDLAIPEVPADAQLLAYYRAHQAQYLEPPTISFTHVYFSTDRLGEARAREAARKMSSELNQHGATRAAGRGDRFPGNDDFAAASGEALARVFGRQGLAEVVFEIEPKRWSEPLRSGFGWHTVYVSAHEGARQHAFEEVRDQVRSDYLEAERERRRTEALVALRRQYRIIRE